MLNATHTTLLGAGDPSAVEIVNQYGRSPFVLTCEHAGRLIPESLGDLGLAPEELARHIAWDIGAADTARGLASLLDAPLVLQRYSRLVVDCNRPAEAPDIMPVRSDGTPIPGNENLSAWERRARLEEIFLPYHETVSSLLDSRTNGTRGPLLLAVHTFTPRLRSNPGPRPWDLGLLYNRDSRLAARFEAMLAGVVHGYCVARNEPYMSTDDEDYTLPVHGERRGIPHMLLEIRNDHVDTAEGARRMAGFLAEVLSRMDTRFS